MQCLYCGKQLPLFKKLTGGGEFCSDAHREKYHEEYNRLALSRLLQAQSKPEDIKVDPKRHGGSIPEPPRGRRANRAEEESPAAVPKPQPVAAVPVMTEPPVAAQKVVAPVPEPPAEPEKGVVAESFEPPVEPVDPAGFLAQIAGIEALAVRRSEAGPVAEAGADALETTELPVLPPAEDPVIGVGDLAWGEPYTSLELSSRWQEPGPRECDLATREFGQAKTMLDFDIANPQIGRVGTPKSILLRVDAWPPTGSDQLVMQAPLAFQIAVEPAVVRLSGLELVGQGFTQSEKRAETPAPADVIEASATAAEPERGAQETGAGYAANGVVEARIEPAENTQAAEAQPAKKGGKRGGTKGRKKANGSATQAEEGEAQEPGVPGPHSIRPVRIPPIPLQMPALAAGFDCLPLSMNPRLLRYSTLPLRPKMAVGTVANPSTGREAASTLHEGSEVGAWAPEFTPVETGGLLSKLGGLLRKR